MTDFLAIGALGCILSIMVIVALRAQRFRSFIRFLLSRTYRISLNHISFLEELLLILVVVIEFSLVPILSFRISAEFLIQQVVTQLNSKIKSLGSCRHDISMNVNGKSIDVLADSLERNFDLRRISSNSHLLFNSQKEMDHQYPTVAKIPVLDTRKFEQWQFRIQQYLQHEHYALWEVIKFGDSYKVPTTTDPDNTTTRKDVEQSGRTVTITTEDMQRKKNDVKARTTLLLSLPDEHQNDLDTMSLDDLYNHLKVYEAEVQKKSNSNFQNMAFISSSKHNSGDEDGNTACVSTSSTTFPTASASIDEDDMEEMDIKWSMALLSIRADKFWKRTGKKISIQGSDVAGFDKSKVECFNCHKMGHFARECRAPKSQERGRKENYRQGSKAEEKTPKALMAIDRELEALKLEKDGLDGKLAGLLKASKNLDNLIESQRPDKVKEGVGYNVVPPPAADLYLSPKKDLSWTGLPEFVDDTVTYYSRPSPTVASTSAEGQKNSSTSEDVASPNTPKPFVKFVKLVKPKDSQSENKTNKQETPKKLQVKYAEQYRHSNKKPNVKGNQRNWNNLKSYQLGPEFVLKKKA
nr:hypothetical protein [Tanacetum cinerariifolium]